LSKPVLLSGDNMPRVSEEGTSMPPRTGSEEARSLQDRISEAGGKGCAGQPPGASKGPREPLWKGPHEDGITFSLLSRFLVCRERFRLYALEGLRPVAKWNAPIGFGDMWHVCEQAFAAADSWVEAGAPRGYCPAPWDGLLLDYAKNQCRLYPTQQQEVDHWYNVVKVTFPQYVGFWSKNQDVKDRTPVFQEQKFRVEYKLPSGRLVYLRGKWDAVDIVGKGRDARVWIQENKTKGNPNPNKIRRQLRFDLQTMLYVVAFEAASKEMHSGQQHLFVPERHHQELPIGGVRYNVVRRPLSGGKGSIRQWKPSKRNPSGETKYEFFKRLEVEIKEAPETYFMRWKTPLLPQDLRDFRERCLDPILEQLCDWWEWVSFVTTNGKNLWDNDVRFSGRPDLPAEESIHNSAIHWRHPYGVFNPLLEDMDGDLDDYLETGSKAGLERADSVFPELQ
jgi:hypothetical protein